jgi:hypothetical protein
MIDAAFVGWAHFHMLIGACTLFHLNLQIAKVCAPAIRAVHTTGSPAFCHGGQSRLAQLGGSSGSDRAWTGIGSPVRWIIRDIGGHRKKNAIALSVCVSDFIHVLVPEICISYRSSRHYQE